MEPSREPSQPTMRFPLESMGVYMAADLGMFLWLPMENNKSLRPKIGPRRRCCIRRSILWVDIGIRSRLGKLGGGVYNILSSTFMQ